LIQVLRPVAPCRLVVTDV